MTSARLLPYEENMNTEDVRKLSPFARLAYWIRERESVRLKRMAGEAKPWTDDEILQQYRFCNVRRMDDAVSVWLWNNWYEPHFDHPSIVYAAAVARFINLPSSLDRITQLVFDSRGPQVDDIVALLRAVKRQGVTIFNGAYMVRGNDGQDKIASVFDYYLEHLLSDPPVIDGSTMQAAHEALVCRYGFGSFMAGQVVADLRWAKDGYWSDYNRWAPVGPGSARGMNRVLGLPVKSGFHQDYFVERLRELIEQLRSVLPESISSRLEAHDYQNCLCEFDKYERALHSEGKPKSRYPGV